MIKDRPFTALGLPAALLANLESLGYLNMTPIQAEAIPPALEGKDLIAQARTGSGKTAAFGIPLLQGIDLGASVVQALVICPTRELTIQVSGEIRRLAKYRNNVKVVAVYGGQPPALQKSALRSGAHIVVGTPGRIKDHLSRANVSLGGIRMAVLDEADRMLEMGFMADVEDILAMAPSGRQTLLFSATFPENILSLSARFQRDPVRVDVEVRRVHADIEQKLFACPEGGKADATALLLAKLRPQSALIFCNTRAAAGDLSARLQAFGHSAAALHGDMEQRDREQVLMRFRHGSCRVLVATDVAARGLDIEDLSAVINFDAPQDSETYVHRIGRTGRAGRTGYAATLFSPSEKQRIGPLRESQGSDIPIEAIGDLGSLGGEALLSDWVTFCIAAGRKEKIRPGDVLGCLTGEGGVAGKDVGKIDVMDYDAYVSVTQKWAEPAFARLSSGKIKGSKYKVRIL